MSQRGSFISEYLYCPDCFEALHKILLDGSLTAGEIKLFASEVSKHKKTIPALVKHWFKRKRNLDFVPLIFRQKPINFVPILGGFVRGLWGGEELSIFENDLREHIENTICHKLQIAVFAESEEGVVLTFIPTNEQEQ